MNRSSLTFLTPLPGFSSGRRTFLGIWPDRRHPELVEKGDDWGLLPVDRAFRHTRLATPVAVVAHIVADHGIDVTAGPELLDQADIADELFDSLDGSTLLPVQLQKEFSGVVPTRNCI